MTEMDRIPLFKVFMAPGVGALVAQTLDSGYVGQGPRVEEFEARLQEALDLPRRPLTVCSGTAGLDLIWHLLGIGPGSEVITTPMTCTATNTNLVTRGARIVWADVDPWTGLIDPMDVAHKVTKKTKAIVAVDWAGRICDYESLKVHWIPVVEDAAHALLATRGGQQVGRCGGDLVMWSFQAIKHLTTVDGGAVLVPESQHARARLLRWYGLDRTKGDSFRCSQDIQEAGYKYHMNDVAATIGLANLPMAEWVVMRHRQNAEALDDALSSVPGITLPPRDPGSSWWVYCVQVDDPVGFMAYLDAAGIASNPVHARNDKHRAFQFPSGPLPGVDQFSSHEVAIPVGWWLTEEDLFRIVTAARSWSMKEGKKP